MVVEPLSNALGIVLSWPTPFWLVLGLIIGTILGAAPGIGPTLGMAIVLPLTLPLNSADAIIFLTTIYGGGMYGGAIAAILLNVPGTASAAASTFDGYPMAKQGSAITALALSATASSLGGILVFVLLILLSPLLIEVVLIIGTVEYFLIALLGLAMITVVSRGSMVKGLTAGFFGLALTTIGMAPAAPTHRFTFGVPGLYDGLDFVAALIGIFAIGEMIALAGQSGGIASGTSKLKGSRTKGIREVISRPILLVKSASIGGFIGSVPGAGASVSNFISYTEAMRSSENADSFGSGNPEGLVASEAANNGTVGGSLIPTMSFGIPGSASTAVLLGGLIMHGLQPGPDLFADNLQITYAVYIALIIAGLLILVGGIVFIVYLGYITKIDTAIIIPLVIGLAMMGGFTLNYNWIDVFAIGILGFIGYFMKVHNYSIIAFILGIVLGPIAEENLARALRISDGSPMIFVSEPLPLFLVVIIFLIVGGPYIRIALNKVDNYLR
ncbi:tripartite tricarboxylate transporter permease [Halorubrum luteum]